MTTNSAPLEGKLPCPLAANSALATLASLQPSNPSKDIDYTSSLHILDQFVAYYTRAQQSTPSGLDVAFIRKHMQGLYEGLVKMGIGNLGKPFPAAWLTLQSHIQSAEDNAAMPEREADHGLRSALRNANGCISGVITAYGHTFTKEVLQDLEEGLAKGRAALAAPSLAAQGEGD